MKFDRELLLKEMEDAVEGGLKDKRPMAFTWGMHGVLTRLTGIVGNHAANSFDFLSKRLSTTDELLADLEKRVSRLEKPDAE